MNDGNGNPERITQMNDFILVNNLIKERQGVRQIVTEAGRLLLNWSAARFPSPTKDAQEKAGLIVAAVQQLHDQRQRLEKLPEGSLQWQSVRRSVFSLEGYLDGSYDDEQASEFAVVAGRGYSIRSPDDWNATVEIRNRIDDYRRGHNICAGLDEMFAQALLAVSGANQVIEEHFGVQDSSRAGVYFGWFALYKRLSPRPIVETVRGRDLLRKSLWSLYPIAPKTTTVKEADLAKMFE